MHPWKQTSQTIFFLEWPRLTWVFNRKHFRSPFLVNAQRPEQPEGGNRILDDFNLVLCCILKLYLIDTYQMVFCVEMSSIIYLYVKSCISFTQIVCLTSTQPRLSMTVPVTGLKYVLSTQMHAVSKDLKS